MPLTTELIGYGHWLSLFTRFAVNATGRLNKEEIGGMLRANEMDDTPESVAALMARFDTDASGDLDKIEFR